MASNSPGTFSRSHQDSDVIGGLLPDVNLPGRFHVDMESGYHGDMASGYHGDMTFVRESGYYVSTSDGASTCSSSTAEIWELDGAALLMLESKSLRSFHTNDEYLFAMKEDLAEWFSSLYQNYDITAGSLFQALETGVLLCKHANKVQECARQSREMGESLEMRSYFIRSVPEGNVSFREGVKPETFQARDNVSNFITWTRELGIPQVLSFETDDLVLRKNEKSVILSLLEVARVGAKLGMLAPTLVQMEQEIDAELAGEEPPPQIQIKTCDLRSLDERVRDLIGRCTCPVQFPMIKVGEGKYQIGGTRSLIFVRILRSHVMVRVGGGWDTLENYLNKHDPCQCHYRGHRSGSPRDAHKMAANQQRRSSNPSHMALCSTLNTPTPQRRTSPVTTTSRNHSASPQTSSRPASPTSTVVSNNIPTPAKSAGVTSSSSKESCVLPSQNQQEATKGSWPLPFSSSSNSSSPCQAIRPNSPRLNQNKGSSPLRQAQGTTVPASSLRTPTSSAVIKGRDQGNKTSTQKKDTVRSINRSALLEEQAGPESPSSCSKLSLEVTTSLSAHKGIVASGKHSEEIARRRSLSQFPEEETGGRATPSLGKTKSRTHAASPSTSDVAKLPVSYPKGHPPSSPVKASKSSSGYGHKISSSQDRTTGKEKKMAISELPEHLKRDAVADVSCAISDWLESTNEIDMTGQRGGQAKTPARSTTVAGSCSSMAQNLNDKSGKEPDTAGNQQEQTSASTVRDRPATSSRIPKPRKASNLVTPKIPSTVSPCSLKSDSHLVTPNIPSTVSLCSLKSDTNEMEHNSSDSHSLKDSNPDQPDIISDASPISPFSLSTSSSDINLAPDRNIFHELEDIRTGAVHEELEGIRTGSVDAQGEELDVVSDRQSSTSSNNSSQRYNYRLTGGKVVKLGADVNNPARISTNRKLSVGSSSPSLSTFKNKDLAPTNYHRRNSVDVKSHTNSLEHAPWPHRASSTSNLETGRQTMIINDITFSDDEEINELIKNSGLKEKATDKNMHSSSLHSRRVLPRKAKENEGMLMISRDGTGHHFVQLTKNEPKLSSTPTSRVTRRTYVGLKDSCPDRADSIHNSNTPDPVMFPKKISPDSQALSKSIKKLLPPSKQAKDLGNEVLATDLSSRPLDEIRTIFAETKNCFFQTDADTIHSPREDIEMFKNMEQLFKKYRETELKSAATESSGRESKSPTSEKSGDT